jgi:hypothetical protein
MKTAHSKLGTAEIKKAVSNMATVSADAAFVCSKKRVDLNKLFVVENRLVSYGEERWHPEAFAAAFTHCILLARQHRVGRDEWARSITEHGTQFGLAAMAALQHYRKTVGMVGEVLRTDNTRWRGMHQRLQQTGNVAAEHHLLDGPTVTKELPSAGRGRPAAQMLPAPSCSSSSSSSSSSSNSSSSSGLVVPGTSDLPALDWQMETEEWEEEDEKYDVEAAEARLDAEIVACQQQIKAEAATKRKMQAGVRKTEQAGVRKTEQVVTKSRKRRRTKPEKEAIRKLEEEQDREQERDRL